MMKLHLEMHLNAIWIGIHRIIVAGADIFHLDLVYHKNQLLKYYRFPGTRTLQKLEATDVDVNVFHCVEYKQI